MGSIEEKSDVSNALFDKDSIASTAFWETYMKGLPRVPSSLFTRIYDYHKSHGGEFHIVNDIGAGFGNFSSELAKRFTEVIVTEPNITSLDLARKHLTPGGTFRRRFRFVNGKTEDNLVEPGSVDLVFAANVMHWAELEPALDAVAKQLKPGGTFFAGLWGMSTLLDKKADDVWIKIMEVINAHCANAFPSERLRQILEIQDSGYDAIPLPEDVWWPSVQRVKLNAYEGAFRVARAWKDDYPLVSNVGPNDKMVFEEDHDWYFETDLDGLKAQANSWPVRPDAKIMGPLWQEMERVLADGKCKGFSPASLILATKK